MYNLINGLNKTFERDASTALASIKEFSETNNFFLCKRRGVFAEQLFEFISVKSVIKNDKRV
jgi:hypothetical protein